MFSVPSHMSHNFSRVPEADIPRSSFDRSHGYKTTFDSGYLVPIFVDEALPGDTFNLELTAFARLATPLHPFMDNMFMDSFFFAVPLRLLWDNFQKFMGEQRNPGDSTDFTVPQVVAPAVGGFAIGSLFDYFGVPTGVASKSISAFASRAYNLIYNEWFRDQNLQNSVVVDVDDGPDDPADYVLLRRGKRHDYFTSCLPWPQKGPAVELPLSGNAPVVGIGVPSSGPNVGPINNLRETDVAGTVSYADAWRSSDAPIYVKGSAAGGSGLPQIYADLTDVAAATINQLRQAFQIQKLYERDARGGTRYTEILKAHFGVTSPDARLQRPEYLGGGSTPVIISPIAQTSSTDETSPQGNLAAMGTATIRKHGFTKSFVEHCIVIGMVSVRADLTYQQGLARMWSRSTRFDFYWPALSHIGEQAVLNQEIYCDGSANDTLTFGYQERWAEYRYKPSLVTGKMRSSDPQSLDTWHLAQDFSGLPSLNSAFIVENPPVERVLAVETEPQFIFDSLFKYRCARPMPTYSVPGLIDHF